MLRDAVGYGIASILEVESNVLSRFNERLQTPLDLEYFTCVITAGDSHDSGSTILSADALFDFARVHKQDLHSKSNTCWFLALKNDSGQ